MIDPSTKFRVESGFKLFGITRHVPHFFKPSKNSFLISPDAVKETNHNQKFPNLPLSLGFAPSHSILQAASPSNPDISSTPHL